MEKQKFGRVFYITCLILAVIVFVIGRLLLPKEVVDQEEYFRPSDLNKFFVFGFIIPIGVIVREFLLLPYVRKIMILKVVISSLIFVGGLLIFFLLPTVSSAIIVYLAYGSLILLLIPSTSFKKGQKE
jgi:hypothetical protein